MIQCELDEVIVSRVRNPCIRIISIIDNVYARLTDVHCVYVLIVCVSGNGYSKRFKGLQDLERPLHSFRMPLQDDLPAQFSLRSIAWLSVRREIRLLQTRV